MQFFEFGDSGNLWTAFLPWFECAQIVPVVKVKYFQTVPNETEDTMKN